MNSECGQNTDREIWRETNDIGSPTIHVTTYGGIGINVGGHVIVAPVEKWHELGELFLCVDIYTPEWKHKLAWWLLGANYLLK